MCHRKGNKTANQESPLKGAKEQRDKNKAPLGEVKTHLKEMKKSGIEHKSGRS